MYEETGNKNCVNVTLLTRICYLISTTSLYLNSIKSINTMQLKHQCIKDYNRIVRNML